MTQHDKLTRIFGALLLFVIVFRFPVKSGEVRASFMVIMDVALTLALASVLWQFANKYVAVFFVMLTISTFYPHYGQASFISWHIVVMGMLWYFFIVVILRDDCIKVFLDIMCYGALLNLFVQCIQATKIPFHISCPVPVGLMANPNETGALYIFCLMAFFRSKWKYAIPLIMYGVYLSNSKMAIACILAGEIMYLFYRGLYAKQDNYIYYTLMVFFTSIIITIMLFVPIESLTLRVAVWVSTFKILKQHWIMGCGLGHWKALFISAMPFDGKRWVTAHNELYQLWAECGVLPFIPLMLYFIDIYKRWRPELLVTTIALIMIVVNCFGNFCFHIPPLAMVALTWMAILEMQLREGVQKPNIQ